MRLGIKVHWRDVDAMARLAREHGASVLEYQMLPGDLERHAKEAFDALLPYRDAFELRVHQPEAYLDGDGRARFLDLASPDHATRDASAQALGEVARHAMELDATALIVHPGGLWRGNARADRRGTAEPAPLGEIGGSSDLLHESLEDIPRHVPFLLENMPAYYDMRNLPGHEPAATPAAFRLPDGLLRLDDLVDGYAFDVSHAYLAAAAGTLEVPRRFVALLGARIRHVHASGGVGGVGGEGEGVPFHESDYGADFIRELLAPLPKDTVVVPEVRDGHRDGGRGFEDALAFLREVLA